MSRPRSNGDWQLREREGRPNWHAYRRLGGRDEWHSLGVPGGAAHEGPAKQALADFIAGLAAGDAPTVGALLEAYLADRKGKVRAWKRLEEAVAPLKRELGHLRPDQVDPKRWARYCADRAVSAGTLRRERNVLVAAFNLAEVRAPRIKPPPAPPPRERYLSRDEAERLLDAFESPHARLLYTICLFTGCRKGQAIALTWDRVDFAANRIDFNEPELPVTVKRRAVVPMGPKLRKAMKEANAVRTTDHVIEWAGERATRVRWPFLRARQKAGLGADVTPHVLRHTAASWLAMARRPIDEAADLLACDPATLRRVYRKFDPSYLKAAVRALEGR